MLDGDYAPMFSLALGRKDVALALEAGTTAGVRMEVAAAVLADMDRAIALGHGDDDIGAVFTATAAEP